MEGPYDVWLTETLIATSSDIDTDVFVSYIVGILEDDEPNEEKEESITGLLCGVVEPDVASQLCAAILTKWDSQEKGEDSKEAVDKGDQLSQILATQTLATVQERKLTKEESERKAAILAQYGQVSDGEEEEEDDDSTAGGDSLLMKNVNKEEVAEAERELREKSRQMSEQKREKDKEDREAQKTKTQDRKESEKKRTQKGERKAR